MALKTERPGRRVKKAPFRFFDLPTLDLDPMNSRVIAPLLHPFLASHRMHDEAAPVFYSQNTFRVLPIHGRFFHTERPLIARLPEHYRSYITKMELYLGLGWTGPPVEWIISDRLGLSACTKLRTLKVYVRFDPSSHPSFEEFQVTPEFYTDFSVGLVRDFFAQAPSLTGVELDGEPELQMSSPILQGVINEAKVQNKRITWGPKGQWDRPLAPDLVKLMQLLSLGSSHIQRRTVASLA
ncbi:hypothetical protein BU24DRAFT_425044 [Aaosphaeria arxii CBS 175.79]|uniref:Uncharacterized protein n=1 Tax=Aaosphaeria arxii CBS 175.79 TaxID=1450172 RepID=A0A6A5XM72_9PLEO|nr:uncharacterized protein BU24DRAFT_425044 [Aaosphaeria arxii CBS 175.79]KAF2014043.1 hypothetical protein BU24DRAFT_425044 [Aaosphaeria arxii CBS 175.79]